METNAQAGLDYYYGSFTAAIRVVIRRDEVEGEEDRIIFVLSRRPPSSTEEQQLLSVCVMFVSVSVL